MAILADPLDSSSNSYSTEAELDSYLDLHPDSAIHSSDAASRERAALFVTYLWRSLVTKWSGVRVDTAPDLLDFPRTGLEDTNGNAVTSTAFPPDVKRAHLYQVAHILQNTDLFERPKRVTEQEIGAIKQVFKPMASQVPREVRVAMSPYWAAEFGSNSGAGFAALRGFP